MQGITVVESIITAKYGLDPDIFIGVFIVTLLAQHRHVYNVIKMVGSKHMYRSANSTQKTNNAWCLEANKCIKWLQIDDCIHKYKKSYFSYYTQTHTHFY